MTVDLLTAKLMENKHMGFDELALLCGVEKSRIKEVWNMLELGFKHIPRTLPTLKALSGNQYQLIGDIVIFIDPFTPIVIPNGLITDLGSIPKSLHWFIDKDDRRFLVPFLDHDVQYLLQFITRVSADARLNMNTKRLSAPIFKRVPMYTALRLFGFMAWHSNSKKTDEREELLKLVQKATQKYHEKHNSVFTNGFVV